MKVTNRENLPICDVTRVKIIQSKEELSQIKLHTLHEKEATKGERTTHVETENTSPRPRRRERFPPFAKSVMK